MMNIIFLNTWHGTLKEELRTYVNQHIQNVDVFCFQEALTEDGTASIPLGLLADFDAYHVTKTVGESVYQNSLYVRRGISILEYGELLTNGDDMGLAQYVVAEVAPSKHLTICNVHGIPQPGHKLDTSGRLRQSRELISAFAYHEAVIIGGDFNLLPEAQSVQMFAQHGYQNLIADYNISSTRNEHTYSRYPDTIQYYADYVFASAGVNVQQFTVPADIVSDHQPMEVSVELVDDKSSSRRPMDRLAPKAA